MIRIGLVGTGKIAREALEMFGEHFQGQIEVVSVYSRFRTVEKARKLAAEFNIPQVFTIYDEMMNQQNIDFVYLIWPSSILLRSMAAPLFLMY